MEKKNKNLLLQDLCSRLPYGVKASYYGVEEECETWDEIEGITTDGYVDIGQYSLSIEGIKPYLFPLSSMTPEQNKEYNDLILNTVASLGTKNAKSILSEELNFYCKYHLDFKGLISKGLAKDATGLNIY